MTARVLRGVGANLYGQAVTVVAQIGTLPVLLQAWGAQALGHWLVLLASTSILSLVDGGLMVAAGNAATLAAGRGDTAEAAELLHRLMRFVLLVGLCVGCGAVFVAVTLPSGWGLGDARGRVSLAALSLAALAGLPLGTVELGYRAAGHYARGAALTNTVRLVETSTVMGIALGGGTCAAAAVGLMLVRVAGAAAGALLMRRQGLGKRRVRPSPEPLSSLIPLIRPALAALAIPAALACSLQGTTMAASFVVPAEAVAALVAARTFTRLLVQALGLVTHALMPEFALAAGQRDGERLAGLRRTNLLAAAALLVPGWTVLVSCGPGLMARWTGRSLALDPLAFDLLASAALVHGSWLSAANLRLAVNQQKEFAFHALAVAAVSCAAAAPLGLALGVRGVALASLAGELVMAALLLPAEIAAAVRPPAGAGPAFGR